MKTVLRLFALLLVVAFISGMIVYYEPGLMSPGDLHPRSLVHKLKGEPLHPWVALRPDEKYVVRFWDVRWPVFRKELLDYESYLEYVVQGFMAHYPNVRVEVRLVDLRTDEEWLRHALNVGDLPDVISAPFDPWFLERGYLADLSLLLDKTERSKYVASSVAHVTENNKIWAYPRWLDLHCLIGNGKVLAASGIDVESVGLSGWTWEGFYSTMQKTKAGGSVPYTINTLTLDGLQAIVESTGGNQPFDKYGNFGWTAKDISGAISVIKNLQDKGIVMSPPGKHSNTLLENLWSGMTAVSGPFGGGMLRHIRERRLGLLAVPAHEKESSQVEAVLLPVPTEKPAKPSLQAGLMSLMVFRNKDARKMKAAAEFARFLATGHFPKITESLQVVSCYLPNADKTVDALIVAKGKAWVKENLKSGGPTIGSFDTPLGVSHLAKARRLDATVTSFWEKPVTAEALIQALHRALVAPPPKQPPRR